MVDTVETVCLKFLTTTIMYTYKVKFDIISSISMTKLPSVVLLFDVKSSDELNDRVEQYRLEKINHSHYLCNVNDIELVYVKEDEKQFFEKLIERQREFSKKVKEGYFDKLKNNPIKTI